jgi:hypothetical protein
MKKGKNLGREWSAADLKNMRALAAKGISARVAAEKLGRSRGAVAFKAMTEGVHFKSIKQSRTAQKRRFADVRAAA